MMMQHLSEAIATCEAIATQSAESAESAPTTAFDSSWITACQTVSNILVGLGMVEESYRWQTMALDPSPSVAKVYAHSGRVYIRCEDWEKAIDFCKRALALQPQNTTLYCRLAKLYHQTGDYKAESQTIYALLQQQPDKATADGHYQLANVMEQHGLDEQAVVAYQQAIAVDPTFLTAYYALGEVFSRQGEQEKAIALLQQLTTQLPDDAEARYRLGRAYRQGGALEDAIGSFREALRLDRELHWAYMGLLNVLLQLERLTEAVEICRGVIHFEGELPWAYCFMGNALAKQGNMAEAATAHQKSFELRGWEACAERGYQFGLTWFGENISLWERHLLPLLTPSGAQSSASSGAQSSVQSSAAAGAAAGESAGESATRPPLQVLSLGSEDDSSLCWLVDTLLQSADDRLLCMTTGASQQFQDNAAKLADAHKLVLQTGELLELLNGAKDNQFGAIYLQSSLKTGDYLNTLATFAWPLLRPGGVMIFKDYQWCDPAQPTAASKIGIDAFVASVAGHSVVLHRSHQVIISKKNRPDR